VSSNFKTLSIPIQDNSKLLLDKPEIRQKEGKPPTLLKQLRGAILARHHSIRTESVYCG
jgi:hypothetical protein